MTCWHCKTEVPDTMEYCPYCGRKLTTNGNDESLIDSQREKRKIKLSPPPKTETGSDNNNTQRNQTGLNTKIKGRTASIGAVAVLLLIAVVLLIGTRTKNNGGNPSNTGSSLTSAAASDAESIDWHSLIDFKEPVPSESNPERRMAHNIYSDPLLDEMSGKYSGFLIDFRSDHDAVCTYWSLCNWSMDTTELASRYNVTDSGWAYAGFQNTLNGKTAIMSFGDIHYNDEKGNDTIIRAKQIYPDNADISTFSGEGEGVNRNQPYEWRAGCWYRMYLNCYEDKDTGHTFVEQWVQNTDTKKWTKISCFDTGLSESFMTGNMSQFMENYDWEYCNEVRSGSIRNIYVRDYDSGEWVAVTKSKLSVDTWYGDKKGSFAFDADKSTLYGITCGFGEDTANDGEDISEVFVIEPGIAAETP